jgi:sortase A
MRAVTRFIASVLLVSGILCLADVGITLVWQEPISALIGSFGQDELNAELDALAQHPVGPVLTTDDARLLADRYESRLRRGHAFGTIVLPKPNRSYAVVQGVDVASLRKGPGHYDKAPVKTAIPGQGKTIGIAGHRTTYLAPFGPNNRLVRGDQIVMKMPYGTFTYEVQRKAAVPPSRIEVLDNKGYERLVLTACHPPFSAAERLIIFAKLIRMAPADRDEPEV